MKMFLKILLSSMLGILPVVAHSYEVATHEEMSSHAATTSVLDTYVLGDIGLDTLDGQRFSGLSIRGWIRDGANHEDDLSLFNLRPVNHFYNPLDGRGYHYLGKTGLPSPSWGLEDTVSYDGQDDSLKDAIDWYYNALTNQNTNQRNDSFVATFSTLGHVMHLVQDAAQPQHTRNGTHITGSLYEKLTNGLVNSLRYDGYDPVSFDRARNFWYTLPPTGTDNSDANEQLIRTGQGMAEYSNRNFLSDATNFRWTGNHPTNDSLFPLPEYENQVPLSMDIRILDPGTTLAGDVLFYGNTVNDSYRPSSSFNQFATTLSIFDADLKNYASVPLGQPGLFTLNRFNYYHAHPYLIPRAVGYSSGLINYFFRGRIEVNAADSNGNLKINIKNISGTTNIFRNGVFEIYYDAVDGSRKPLTVMDPATAVVDSSGMAVGNTRDVTVYYPNDVDSTKPNPFIAIFKGVVGAEQAVVARVFQLETQLHLYVGWTDYGPYSGHVTEINPVTGKIINDMTVATASPFLELLDFDIGSAYVVATDYDATTYLSKYESVVNGGTPIWTVASSSFVAGNPDDHAFAWDVTVHDGRIYWPIPWSGGSVGSEHVSDPAILLINNANTGDLVQSITLYPDIIEDRSNAVWGLAFLGVNDSLNEFYLLSDEVHRTIVFPFSILETSHILTFDLTSFALKSKIDVEIDPAMMPFMGYPPLSSEVFEGFVYVANPTTDRLEKWNLAGQIVGTANYQFDSGDITGLEIDEQQREIYTSDVYDSGIVNIYVFDIDTLELKRTIPFSVATLGVVPENVIVQDIRLKK